MRSKSTMKKLFTKFTLLFALITPFVVNTAMAVPTQAATREGISTRRPIIEYRYKLVNGYLYRRLYDATNDKWLGPWKRA